MQNNKKVLCLGNTTTETDNLVTLLAKKNSSTNFGLITDCEITPTYNGFYHTTLGDIGPDDIITLAKKFDCIIIFDQPIESYDNRDLYCITKQVSLILKNIINKPIQILGSSDV